VQGLEAGANDYLAKPVDLDELVARVRAQVRERDAWRSRVADVLHHRATLAGAIASIGDEGLAPEVVAGQIIDLLIGVDAVRGVALIELTNGEGRVLGATHLAAHGLTVGQALPAHLMAEVLQIAEAGAGPVLARTGVLPPDQMYSRFPAVEGDIVASVLGHGEPWGVMLLETEPGAGRGPDVLRRAGVAAADLLPVVERVLGPALAQQADRSVTEALLAIIEERAFVPHYQPIFELSSGRAVGFEALTRFADGIRPDRRFAQAERAGLGRDLERVTVEAALVEAGRLPTGAYVTVNVSAATLIAGILAELLPLAGERPVVLEVTEHEEIEDYDAVRAAVAALGPGVRLSVDDAGSGWASLRHVFSLKPDYVKVDRGWVDGIDEDPARQALLLGIARFVELTGGSVVAEGIETRGELVTLEGLGIPMGQGFLLGRPGPVAEQTGRSLVDLPPQAGGGGVFDA
jgi:EAL domain-containing protein (putative c-di-GMP-specific phosphodiesterase class I)